MLSPLHFGSLLVSRFSAEQDAHKKPGTAYSLENPRAFAEEFKETQWPWLAPRHLREFPDSFLRIEHSQATDPALANHVLLQVQRNNPPTTRSNQQLDPFEVAVDAFEADVAHELSEQGLTVVQFKKG